MKHCTLALSKKLAQVVLYHHPCNQLSHNLEALIISWQTNPKEFTGKYMLRSSLEAEQY